MNARDYYKSVNPDRREWAINTIGRCFNPDCKNNPEDIHEIEARSAAPRTWGHRCNYAKLCKSCHMHNAIRFPQAQQLAWKYHWDKEHFDLKTWNTLRAPNGNTIKFSDIKVYLEELEDDDRY